MADQSLQATIVIPAYNEGDAILPVLARIRDSVKCRYEVRVVVDFPEDTTISAMRDFDAGNGDFQCVISTYGRGPANAIRFGLDTAAGRVAVVTMADGSDDPQAIDPMVRLVDRGVVVAAASRYMRGGQQVGAPFFKSQLSRNAGRLLHWFAGVGTHDATNSFKAYDVSFIRQAGIHSTQGFELALELVSKARRMRLPIAEVPTIWLERDQGVSNFKLRDWLPHYIAWFLFAFGRSADYSALRIDANRAMARKDKVLRKGQRK